MTGPDYVTSSDGVQIACFHEGSGPPLVMLHGGGNDHTFAPELTRLLSQTYHVVKPDRRGRGASGDHDVYSAEKEADDLRAVMASCSEPPVLFGNSFGAFITLVALCRTVPDVRRVVLFEPPFEVAPNPRRQDAVRQLVELAGSDDPEAALVFHQTQFHSKTKAHLRAMQKDTADWALRVSRVRTTAREMELLHCRHLFDVGSLLDPGCGIDLIYGSDTLPFLREGAEKLDQVPFLRTTCLDGITHSGPVTHPHLIADHILPLE